MSDENAANFSNGSVDAEGLRPWVVVLFVSLSGCAFGGGLMATGEVGGHALSGPVDHQVARAYLEKSALPTPLRRLRTSMLSSRRVPSPATLAEVSRVYSPDVATLLLLEAMSAQPATQALRKRYEEELQFVDRVGLDQARPTFPEDLLVLMVPGWFYASHGAETNADFRIQRQLYREWGVAHRLVEIQENGSVEENAKIVAAAIRAASNQRVFVVSASKSGAEVAQALGRELRAEETSHVVGWLSIVGVVRGSALADRVLEPDLCWLVRAQLALEGFGLEGLLSLRASSGRDTFAGLRLPPKVPRLFDRGSTPVGPHLGSRRLRIRPPPVVGAERRPDLAERRADPRRDPADLAGGRSLPGRTRPEGLEHRNPKGDVGAPSDQQLGGDRPLVRWRGARGEVNAGGMKARWTALGVMALTLGVAQLAPEPVGACRIVTHDTDDRDQGVNASSPSPPVIRSAKWVRQFVEGQGGGCDCEEPYPCGGGDGGDGVIRFLELSYEAEFPRIRLVQGDEVPKYILPDNRTSPFQVVLYHYDLPNNSLPMRLALSTLDEEGNRSLTVTTTITATEDRGFER